MNVIDSLNSCDKTAFSFEVLPPIKGTGTAKLFSNIERLMEFKPKYINITTHHSEPVYTDMGDGTYKRSTIRRRPGTVAVATAIQHRFGVPVVPHILCNGYSLEETEYVLIDLQLSGINDILVLRGDRCKEAVAQCKSHAHAIDLLHQVNRFNEGYFVDGSPMKERGKRFTCGVACYPEKHDEAPNMESDLYWLKKKVEAGAEYAVTQLFYDNQKYFEFVKKARQAGIMVPIIPGIKPLKKMSQLSVIPKTFKVDIPKELTDEVQKCSNDEQVKQVGIEWCIKQCRELIAHGVPSIHFYTVSAVDSIREVAKVIY